ncbi:general substrate transporter [Penicillium riverlandense]|uniref:general substrate transporter n=1 Tax=Penicillium riverlandense TaxID=1903569 RepID=UPI002547A569|nr:general substrate transporter [Penicillium riverlandense]KAJ5806834.1 general substrate transporter [Penicillium riverlandense]
MKSGVYQFLIGCFAAFGSFLFGYDLGVIAEVVAASSFKTLFLQSNADAKSGTVVSLYTGGCFFGALGAGFTDRLGRRGTILMACIIFTIGGIIQSAGVRIEMLYVGRLLAGFGTGFLVMIIPIYQAEISHRRIRGRITTLQQLFSALGQVTAGWVAYGCYAAYNSTNDSREWRIPLAIQIIPALFLGSLVYQCPESPRWLCDHGKADQGLKTLARLHSHGDADDAYVIAEFNLIQTQLEAEHAEKTPNYLDLFRSWPQFRRIIIIMAIQAGCQGTGISAIQYFSPQIFAQLGIPVKTTLLMQAVNALVGLAGTSLCIVIIELVGRRPLEIGGSLIMTVTFAVNAALIKIFPASVSNTGAHWGFIVMTWVFNFVFFVTSGPLSWAIPPELFGNAMRDTGVSWGTMTSFAFNTLVGQVTPIAISAVGWKYYIVFVVCNFTTAIFFWAFLPETKGLNLEDLEELFKKSPVFIPRSKWVPSSHIELDAKRIAEKEMPASRHIEQVEDGSV